MGSVLSSARGRSPALTIKRTRSTPGDLSPCRAISTSVAPVLRMPSSRSLLARSAVVPHGSVGAITSDQTARLSTDAKDSRTAMPPPQIQQPADSAARRSCIHRRFSSPLPSRPSSRATYMTSQPQSNTPSRSRTHLGGSRIASPSMLEDVPIHMHNTLSPLCSPKCRMSFR